jgi:hypothetical protein
MMMRKQIKKPIAANANRSPVPALVLLFPTDLYAKARLHARCITSDACAFWKEVREGYAVAVEGAGALDAIWVRDSEARAAAAAKWHDIPILIAGELRSVSAPN